MKRPRIPSDTVRALKAAYWEPRLKSGWEPGQKLDDGGWPSQKQLALRFGVSVCSANEIVHGRRLPADERPQPLTHATHRLYLGTLSGDDARAMLEAYWGPRRRAGWLDDGKKHHWRDPKLGILSYREVGLIYGVSDTTVAEYVLGRRLPADERSRARPVYTEAQRKLALMSYRKGVPVWVIEEALGMNRTTLYEWLRKAGITDKWNGRCREQYLRRSTTAAEVIADLVGKVA